MTQSPSLCSSLDAYLDGDLPDADARAFETHVEACSECTADLAAARLLNTEWTRLATATAPVGLIDSALREAKRGTRDRQPAPPARRRMGRFAGVVAFSVLLIALASTALWMQSNSKPTAPLQASATPPATVDSVEAPQADPVPTEAPPRQLDAPPAPSTPRQRATPARRPAPARRQPAPAPPPAPVEPPVQLVQQAPADSVAQAKDDLMLALALVADAQSRAGSTVTTEIGRAAGALSETTVF